MSSSSKSSSDSKSQNSKNTESQSSLDRSWIAEVSHELRLPIANIKLLVETLLDGALEDKETLIRMLKRTSKEVDRLEGLVKDVLSIEHVTHNQQEDLKREQVYLIDSSVYAMETTADLASKKSIKIRCDVDEEYKIYANKEQLNQVVLNLVSNAVKFTPAGGEVTIKAGWTAGGGQYISIRDNGPGIPEDEIPLVMQAFGQGAIAIKSAEDGTGLGLPIVQALVQMHGGKFELKSKLREGTEALVTFPSSRVLEAMPALEETGLSVPASRRASSRKIVRKAS